MKHKAMAIGGTGFLALLTVAVPPAPAQADENCFIPYCGRVSNFTNNHMKIASIDDDSGAETCYFRTEGNRRCNTRTLPVGTTNGDNTFRDADGFTFTGTTFTYNGSEYGRYVWVRVTDPQWVVCQKIPGLRPSCWG